MHHDLMGETEIQFSDEMNDDIDVLFLCVGHGDSKKFLEENEIPKQIKIISLSEDFRLKENSVFQNRQFVYGLPEIKHGRNIARRKYCQSRLFCNRYSAWVVATCKNECLGDVYTTGITGSTGAGQTLSPLLIFHGVKIMCRHINH